MELEVRNLRKEFKREKITFDALKGVDLSAKDHEFISLIGNSGSGKSTFLNLLAGMLVPSDGAILIDGKDVTKQSDKEASRLRNTIIGYIPQGQSLLSNLSVIDNVRLPFFLSKREGNPDKKAKELLEELGIGNLANSYPNSLSGGEMRRVAIARALINDPKILLADEPTGDLDKENTEAIIGLFRRIADSGTAVIMVTHDLGTVSAADVNYVMDKGILTKESDEKIRQLA